MDSTAPAPDSPTRDDPDDQVLFGVALMLFGFAVLAHQADWVPWQATATYWPFILVLLGLVQFIVPGPVNGRQRPRRTALWLLSIGAWGAISEFRWFGLHYGTSWPLLVVAAGLNMVLKSLEGPADRRQVREH